VFLMHGIKATAVSSDEEQTGNRTQKIKDFKDGKYDVIINVNLLTKGFDLPIVSCIVAAAPTKSLTRYMQAVGRGTRTLTGCIDGLETVEERWKAIKTSAKKDCLIIDIVDNTTKHSIVNAWNLDRELSPNDRVFITQEKRDKLNADRLARSVKIDHNRDKDERVKLLRIPRIKRSNSIRMKQAATEKQLEWIKSLGYDVEKDSYTHEMCTEIIGKLAASKQKVEEIKKLGYDAESKIITNEDYNAVMREIWIKNKRKEESKNKYKPNRGEEPF